MKRWLNYGHYICVCNLEFDIWNNLVMVLTSHCPLATFYWKSKTHSQFLDIWCIFDWQTTFHLEDCPKLMSFFVNPKIWHHFWIPTLETLSLGPKRFLHSKGPKNVICLWLRLGNIKQSQICIVYFWSIFLVSAKDKSHFWDLFVLFIIIIEGQVTNNVILNLSNATLPSS